MQLQSYPYLPTNTELVARCRAGDARAWDILVERYARLVRAVAARHGASREDVDDITQDVFLLLARNLEQIEDAESLGKWLLVTTRHRSWRFVHQRSREQPALVADLAEAYPFQAVAGTLTAMPGLSELAELWSQREILSYGLEQLGDRCSHLLYMLFLDPEQPSYETICARLDIPKGSIGPSRKRCLEHLRSILEAWEVTNLRS